MWQMLPLQVHTSVCMFFYSMDGAHSMQDWAMDTDNDKVQREKEDAEKEERLDREDPDELRKAREWDEHRDGR